MHLSSGTSGVYAGEIFPRAHHIHKNEKFSGTCKINKFCSKTISSHKINNGNEANLLADNGVTLGNSIQGTPL